MEFVAKYRKEIQILLEFLILVVGWFMGWRLSIIIFFLMLDVLGKYTLSWLQWTKMSSSGRINSTVRGKGTLHVIGYTLLATVLLFGLLALVNRGNVPDHLGRSVETLVNAADDEIWLVPLIFLTVFVQYKLEFVKGMEYRLCEPKGFFLRRGLEALVLGLVVAVLVVIETTGVVAVLSLAGTKLIIDWLTLRKEQQLMKRNLTQGY